ncbi:MAG: response regulator [Candidatus Saccharimonadales bacterium]
MTKVLLVEDDINLREIYAARLSAEGYDLITASDGEEALSKAVSEKPSLIVLDVMMPKISGFDVLDILRSTPETETTKVIMLSALSQQTDRERGEKLGANKYLIKSQITLEDVVSTVKSMIEEGEMDEAADDSPTIVTTASGRLPGDDTPATTPTPDGATPATPVDQATTDDVASNDTPADPPISPQALGSTADEIAHIDSQMQKKNPNQQ